MAGVAARHLLFQARKSILKLYDPERDLFAQDRTNDFRFFWAQFDLVAFSEADPHPTETGLFRKFNLRAI